MKLLLPLITLLLIGCGGKDYHTTEKFNKMCNSYEMQICGDVTNYMQELGITDLQLLQVFYKYEKDTIDTFEPIRQSGDFFVGDCEDIALSTAELMYMDTEIVKIVFVAGERDGCGHAWLEVTNRDGVEYRYDVGSSFANTYVDYERIILKDET